MKPVTYKPNPDCEGGMEVHRYGKYVSEAEYNELKKQVERLTEEREQMESHYEDDTQTIAELRKELEDAQESNHILNETIARLMKGAKR